MRSRSNPARRLLGAVLARAGERLGWILMAAEPGSFLRLGKADALQHILLRECRTGE